MLPFPRLLNYGNNIDPNVLIDIDFERQQIGDTNIIDFAGHSINTLRGSGATVVYDSTIQSNVMHFPGTHSFVTPIIDNLKLSTLQFDVDCIFLNSDSTPFEVIFETGNYTQGGYIIGGMSLTLNQYTSTYIQGFLCTSTTNYNRVLLTGTNTHVWETVKMQVRNTGITIINSRTGVSNSYSRFSFGDGTSFSIGGSYVSVSQYPYFFNGYLKSLKITKV